MSDSSSPSSGPAVPGANTAVSGKATPSETHTPGISAAALGHAPARSRGTV